MRPVLSVLAALAAATALSGCQWFERRETLSLQSGDAIAWNKAIHTIDPWPAASADTAIPTSGRRIAKAIEIYESGPTPQGNGGGAPGGLVPIIPMAPGAPPSP